MPDHQELILNRLARLTDTLELLANNLTIQAKRLHDLLHLTHELYAHVSELTQTRQEIDR